MHMKKFIIRVVAFVILVMSADQAVGYIGDYMIANVKSGRDAEIKHICFESEYDIIVLGSSRACHHYVPTIIEDSLNMDACYNAGFDGNGVILMYSFLKQISERYTPKLVIYDVEPAFDYSVYLEDNNRKRYIDNLKPYYTNQIFKDIINDIDDNSNLKCLSGFYRYNCKLIQLYFEYKNISDEHVCMKGYKPLEGTIDGTTSAADRTQAEKDTTKIKYLKQLIELAQEKDIPLVLTASPKYKPQDYQKIKEIEAICKSYGIPFVDMYLDEEFQDKDLFKDTSHLNNLGAEEFTKKIVRYINKIL